MTDHVTPAELAEMRPRKRAWIPRETWRQEKAVVFARDAIVGPHKFIAHDRAANQGREHLWQAKRGVRKGLPDTQLILPGGKHVWFEFKSPGNKPDDDQWQMLKSLVELGDAAAWGVTIEGMRSFWQRSGVPMVPNAAYRAMVLDGLVDSRIAKAEAKATGLAPTSKKKSRPRKVEPRNAASKGMVRRAAAKGIFFG